MKAPGFTAKASLSPATGHYKYPSRSYATQADSLVRPQLELDIYGNWCGPGHSGPGAPVDAVDEVCCRHDQCFCSEGYDDCACNRQAILDMPGAILDSSSSVEGKALGAAIAAALLAAPCVCDELCLPFVGCTDGPDIPGLGGVCIPPSA